MRSAVFQWMMVVLVVGMAPAAAAQTNAVPQFSQWFVLPQSHLRADFTEPPGSASGRQDGHVGLSSAPTERGSAAVKGQSSDRFVLSVDDRDGDAGRDYLRQRDFGFIKPAHGSDDLLTRAFDIFRPEEFRVGKTATASCSLWTAIKRKNPFCLLNPIILKVSW
jgi:hypothetical protein